MSSRLYDVFANSPLSFWQCVAFILLFAGFLVFAFQFIARWMGPDTYVGVQVHSVGQNETSQEVGVELTGVARHDSFTLVVRKPPRIIKATSEDPKTIYVMGIITNNGNDPINVSCDSYIEVLESGSQRKIRTELAVRDSRCLGVHADALSDGIHEDRPSEAGHDWDCPFDRGGFFCLDGGDNREVAAAFYESDNSTVTSQLPEWLEQAVDEKSVPPLELHLLIDGSSTRTGEPEQDQMTEVTLVFDRLQLGDPVRHDLFPFGHETDGEESPTGRPYFMPLGVGQSGRLSPQG